MTRFVSRVSDHVRRVVRPIIQRLPFARPLLASYRQARARLVHFAKQQLCSAQNLGALRALSNRRFNALAVGTARPVGEPPNWPYIDISVVSYNSARWVASFVQSLCAQHYPLERMHLIWVDHGSTDATLAALDAALQPCQGRFASVTRLTQPNLGFGAGHNRALQQGASDWCLVTNLDLDFSARALTTVVATALADTQGAVASWELRQAPYEHPKYYDPVTLETNWSAHACVLFRRRAFEQVGGYDDRIFMYAEDVELSYRLRSHGYVLKYVPSATVQHYAYDQAGQIKPVQFTGSLLGNVYIRWRYGRWNDILMGLALYAAQCLRRSAFPGARRSVLAGIPRLLGNARHFSRGKGFFPAFYPLRGFDYELHRDGAFHAVAPLPGGQAAPLPRVTIITRTYQGRGLFLRQAMASVFNQTWPAIELIVVQDGGDSQQALVQQLAAVAPPGCQVRFLANPKLGRSAAGNAGLAAASGAFIMFLDDDDLLFADHVETLVSALLAHPDHSAAYALALEVMTDLEPDGSQYIETSFFTPRAFYQPWDHAVLQQQNFIPIQAIVFRRELYEERGGFDTDLDQLEDWHLWLRYGYRSAFCYVPKTTSLFRSPSDYAVRTARAAKLHEAYDQAKMRAQQAFNALDARWAFSSVDQPAASAAQQALEAAQGRRDPPAQ